VVQTAWAVLGLMYAKYPKRQPIERAVRLIMSRQLPVSGHVTFSFTPSCSVADRGPLCTRMAHGRRKPSKGSSTRIAPSHTRISSSAGRFGRLERLTHTYRPLDERHLDISRVMYFTLWYLSFFLFTASLVVEPQLLD
jgi:hypothetical protein